MMFAVQLRAWWAWYIAMSATSVIGAMRSVSSGFPTASGPLPAARPCWITSVFHHEASCSAIRRVLSPMTRSRRSIAAGRNPSASWSSMNGTIVSSSSRIRSSGAGGAMPIASRTTARSSNGTPVRSLTCWNVSAARPANRSKPAASAKPSDRAPCRIAVTTSSSGMPAPSSERAISTRRTSPGEKRSGASGVRMPSSTSRATYDCSTPARSATSSPAYRITSERLSPAGLRGAPCGAGAGEARPSRTTRGRRARPTTTRPARAAT